MFTAASQTENSGSLIADPWPPGFEDGGRRVLAECNEMTLYELYRPGGEQEVVLAPEIERILWRHLFRMNDTFDFGSFERKDRDRRVSLAMAINRLHHFTVHRHRKGERIGSMQAAQALAESLGEDIDRAIKSDNVKEAARQVGNRVAECVKALAREKGKLRDGRAKKDRIPLVAMLILVGAGRVHDPRREASKRRAYILDGAAWISLSRQGFSGPLERNVSKGWSK